jgi:signal transduction histidine kinase
VIEHPLRANPLVRWVRSIPPLVQDTALALVLTVTLVIDLARQDIPPGGPVRPADTLGYVLVAMLILPLALRRRLPREVFLLVLVDAVVVGLLLYRPTSFGFGLIVATYTVARWCDPSLSLFAFVIAQAFGIFIKARGIAAGLDPGWFSWPLDAVYFGAAWFLGYSIRTRNEYAIALEKNREALAERAVQDERTRIARELHDAVGHSISVMVLHAGGAERVLDSNPDRARRAMVAVGDVGRAALAEMDQLLGILRAADGEANPILRPSLTNLDDLVDDFRELGLDIDTEIDGDPVPLPPVVDQSAFRIVQEALTNTLKHAGPTRAEVSVTYSGSDVIVDVRDHGGQGPHGGTMAVDHHARGLIGMRERATLVKGDLDVGPCDDTGFRVRARLPIRSVGAS